MLNSARKYVYNKKIRRVTFTKVLTTFAVAFVVGYFIYTAGLIEGMKSTENIQKSLDLFNR